MIEKIVGLSVALAVCVFHILLIFKYVKPSIPPKGKKDPLVSPQTIVKNLKTYDKRVARVCLILLIADFIVLVANTSANWLPKNTIGLCMLVGSAILSIVCSFVFVYFWNKKYIEKIYEQIVLVTKKEFLTSLFFCPPFFLVVNALLSLILF